MISHSQIYHNRASLATHYYADQADDYYSRDGKAATWQGEGARRLSAIGEIDPTQFKAMLQGYFGRGVAAGQSIRKDAKARAALDLTFGAPKSITLQALVGGDERLIHANDKAVAAATGAEDSEPSVGFAVSAVLRLARSATVAVSSSPCRAGSRKDERKGAGTEASARRRTKRTGGTG